MKFRRHHSSDAFTLLEIMVAIGLLAMVVAAIYSCWNSILKGTRAAMGAAAVAQRERITMRTLHDSLLCACMFNAGGTNQYYSFIADTESEDSSISFVAQLPKSFPRSGKFGDLTMRRLQYTVEPGADGKKQLVLRQRPIIMKFDPDEAQFPLVLAHDVNKFQVEFVDPKSGDWVSEWDYTNQLPTEIRVTVALGHADQFTDKAQEAMVDVVAPPAVSIPAAYQTPTGQNGGINNLNPNNPNNPNGPGINRPGRITPGQGGFNPRR